MLKSANTVMENQVDHFGFVERNPLLDKLNPMIEKSYFAKRNPGALKNKLLAKVLNDFCVVAQDLQAKGKVSDVEKFIEQSIPTIANTVGFSSKYVIASHQKECSVYPIGLSKAENFDAMTLVDTFDADFENLRQLKTLRPKEAALFPQTDFYEMTVSGSADLKVKPISFEKLKKEVQSLPAPVFEIEQVRFESVEKMSISDSIKSPDILIKAKKIAVRLSEGGEPVALATCLMKKGDYGNNLSISIETASKDRLKDPGSFYRRLIQSCQSSLYLNEGEAGISKFLPVQEFTVNKVDVEEFLSNMQTRSLKNFRDLSRESSLAVGLLEVQSKPEVQRKIETKPALSM